KSNKHCPSLLLHQNTLPSGFRRERERESRLGGRLFGYLYPRLPFPNLNKKYTPSFLPLSNLNHPNPTLLPPSILVWEDKISSFLLYFLLFDAMGLGLGLQLQQLASVCGWSIIKIHKIGVDDQMKGLFGACFCCWSSC
ncbi:unnamed protein product, partial [Linum tenue]